MKITNSKDLEDLLDLISLPTMIVENEKMATDNIYSFFIQESTSRNKKIVPHPCQQVTLTYIEQSIDGYKAGEDDGKEFEKEVFTYGRVDIKERVSLLVCIEVSDYKQKHLDKVIPIRIENIISFKNLQNRMKYGD
ncbi:MAG: hypothetical protein WCL02_03390 [bacterium]